MTSKLTEIPATMTAIEILEPGGPEKLTTVTRSVEAPGKGEVLVKVAAAGINKPDVMQRQGMYPAPKGATDIPGLEVAGVIVAIGEDVTFWKPGDEVCALVSGGGYAEYCLAPAVQCLVVPKGLDMIQAAALPETLFTVWANIVDRAHLQKGETLLIHGGSSGIGTTAIQIGCLLGARIFVTAGSPKKCAVCEELGAEIAINYNKKDFVDVLMKVTAGKGVNVILDMVGGDYLPRNISLLAADGRLVNIAYQKGSKVEVNFLPVMLKRLTITGSTLRIRPVEVKGAIARALRKRVWPHIESGDIAPLIHATFPLTQANKAHSLMESGAHMGKIVLKI
ncbi:MAG: NAD(P)H-quinone oxidoreductase [Alphaproteobacteria bacterium]|jgi:putative PIG3 family NAD(P)H quinone oxidoreductase|nr:NAD(P)H-quinone oxidoreductase [Alphaproteobacteria bacterium]